MRWSETRERQRIEAFLRRAPDLHLYELGDLDPEVWPHTRWWMDGADEALAMLYGVTDPPTLLALCKPNCAVMPRLLMKITPELPAEVYAHLTPGLVEGLTRYRARSGGVHHKMSLARVDAVMDAADERIERAPEANSLLEFYRSAYPDHWFDPTTAQLEHYFVERLAEGSVAGVAGVHVASKTQRVAALGNIATSTAHRGQGVAFRTTAAVCRSLLSAGIRAIGLNVDCANTHAIRCYERLGFAYHATYEEWSLSAHDG